MSTEPTPQAPHTEVSPKDSFILGIGFAWELGYTIAIPAVLFGFGGTYLDTTTGYSPLFLLVGLLLAFVVSFSIIGQKIKFILSRMPQDLPKKKKKESPLETEAALEQQALHELFRPPNGH